jgi:uncharacterized membrane protein
MRQSHLKWLYDELPGLVAAGILPEDTAQSLRAHYGPLQQGGLARMALVFVAVLGAALVGLGVILLFAHNWETLSRPMRTVLSFLPMLLGQALVAYALSLRRESVAWREGTGIFLTLAIGACIALIGQTYHIPGNLASFLFVWVLLALPLVYLLNAAGVAALYLVGIVAWAGFAQVQGGHALWFWPLLLAVLPHLYLAARKDQTGPRFAFLSWVFCAAACVATGIVLEKSLPGLWVLVYSALFAVLYLLGRQSAYASKAFRVFGAAGIVVLALLFTYDWPWREIGFRHYRRSASYYEWVAIQDYILCIGLYVAAGLLALRPLRAQDYYSLLWLAFPAIAALAYSASNAFVPDDAILVTFNIYLLVLGILTLVDGARSGRLGRANLGMAILSALLVARFFDADIGFTLRGVLFILLGAGFLATNVVLGRRLRGQQEIAS